MSNLTTIDQHYTPDVTRRAGVIHGPGWRFLAETSGRLDASLDHEETLTNILRFVVPRIADAAILATPANDLRVFSLHRDRARQPMLEAIAPHWAQCHRLTRQSEDILRALDPVSTAFVPLVARDRSLGSLMLIMTTHSARRYTGRDITLAGELGRRAALALDNALRVRASAQAAHAREEMMAIVSHDLRNPLATIQMAVRFLLEDLTPDDPAQQPGRAQLRVIHRSAERMSRMVHDLLDVSALEAGRLPMDCSPFDAELLIADAVELLGPLAASRRIALLTSTESALPRVFADRERILQVFSNLGGNAMKFTPGGGSIEIGAALRDGVVEFSVRDTGAGISPSDLPHIFDRFWQAAMTKRNGLGLGLAIVYGIVQAHGGEIHVESSPGHGSMFRFTLPIRRS